VLAIKRLGGLHSERALAKADYFQQNCPTGQIYRPLFAPKSNGDRGWQADATLDRPNSLYEKIVPIDSFYCHAQDGLKRRNFAKQLGLNKHETFTINHYKKITYGIFA